MLAPPELAELAAEAGLRRPGIVVGMLAGAEPAFAAWAAPDEGPALPAASMIKLPIGAALAARLAAGTLDPQARLAVAPEVMTPNDAASPLVPGYRASYDELGELMLTRSDNVATNLLIRALGRRAITAEMRALGLGATAVRRLLSGSLPLIADPEATGTNAHPPADAARLLAALAAGELLGSAHLRRWLGGQIWNDGLAAGWFPGDRFLHKTGETDECSHDGGILEGLDGLRAVVVVYTGLRGGPEANARLARFAALLRPRLARGC
ncbi:MAG: serine hydrolase [Vulcanimicrobiaceae bacterium]